MKTGKYAKKKKMKLSNFFGVLSKKSADKLEKSMRKVRKRHKTLSD